jgi:hypothetical protein
VGYYDGVLDGVADFNGRPHSFVLHDDLNSPAPVYRLAPLSSDAMTLFEEAWQIFRRWERARLPAQVGPDTVAALPEDLARHDEIEPRLKVLLSVPEESPLKARGHFVPRADADLARDGRWAMDLEWTPT